MVFGLQSWSWFRAPTLAIILGAHLFGNSAAAAENPANEYLKVSKEFYRSGEYFKAARYAFAASQNKRSLKPEAYSWVTLSLVEAGLYSSASYFFIKTLQTGNSDAVRRVLKHTELLLVHVGPDLLRKYLVRHTNRDDYDSLNRSAFFYSLGKDLILRGKNSAALKYLSDVRKKSPLWAHSLLLRGTANAIMGQGKFALEDFSRCATNASAMLSQLEGVRTEDWVRLQRRQAEDLTARCQAGHARTLYQMNEFDEADRSYDRIPKSSFVWTDILFEQAWNSFARREYNRTLGKLVTYKSPHLNFVFNSEVDVLRSQAYLALCLYGDANSVINEFHKKYTGLGKEIKHFVEDQNKHTAFYKTGKKALDSPLHTNNRFYRLMNRFIRGPYFQNLVQEERSLESEQLAIGRFAKMLSGATGNVDRGFPGFLKLVLKWRQKTVRLLGGVFIRNSLLDYHQNLISDFEKMAFIKLEMLGRAKERLQFGKSNREDRSRGAVAPSRRDDQYFWSFNGEFWNDELGDYVFGLKSECKS